MNKAQSMLNLPVCCLGTGTGRTVSCREVRGSEGIGGGECCTFALSQIFSRSGIFRGLSQYIMNIAGRVSDAAMDGAEGAQRPVLRVNEP